MDEDGRVLQGITTIKPYAFAGVKFSRIELPSSIEEVGDYVFFNSEIAFCYTSAINWKLTDRSFSKVENRDADITVVITSNPDGIDEFLSILKNTYGVDAEPGGSLT